MFLFSHADMAYCLWQRFIMILTDHLAKCEGNSIDYNTPWYKWVIERLQQIFLLVCIFFKTRKCSLLCKKFEFLNPVHCFFFSTMNWFLDTSAPWSLFYLQVTLTFIFWKYSNSFAPFVHNLAMVSLQQEMMNNVVIPPLWICEWIWKNCRLSYFPASRHQCKSGIKTWISSDEWYKVNVHLQIGCCPTTLRLISKYMY